MGRLSIELEEDLHAELNAEIPWGIRGDVVKSLIKKMLHDVKEKGPAIIYELLKEEPADGQNQN